MTKQIQTVRVNDIQLATFKALARGAQENGVIPAEVASGYKGNVVHALVRAGALKPFHSHYKLTGAEVTLLVRKPQARTLEKLALAA